MEQAFDVPGSTGDGVEVEIARVSKLLLMERYRYVAWMIDDGRRHGVKHCLEPRGATE